MDYVDCDNGWCVEGSANVPGCVRSVCPAVLWNVLDHLHVAAEYVQSQSNDDGRDGRIWGQTEEVLLRHHGALTVSLYLGYISCICYCLSRKCHFFFFN